MIKRQVSITRLIYHIANFVVIFFHS